MSRKLILVTISVLLITSLAASQNDARDLSAAASQGYIEGSFIVEFDTEPVAKRAQSVSSDQKAYRAEIENRHERFRRSLRQTSMDIVVGRGYSQSFNGMALSGVSKGDRQKLENMPMVEEVHRDYIYRTKLDESVPQIGAQEVWDQKVSGTNNTGRGITIAIIDTGVAYTHPDLGNCTEQEFSDGNCGKVVGGYDFVNDDSNPMDDKGHGTHVAATAAGNGTLDGVAPSADVLGYKVLDSYGYGSTSDIIAGIDEAAKQGSDVISLSLGGPGHPDDAMSDAVNNAVLNGSVVTVAAGNEGEFYTVGSPGTARKAITVGSVDKSDQLSGFSSKGPVVWNNGEDMITKPDLMAPGEDICAARWNDSYSGYECLDGEHVSLRGTSMATPHVAGAAALMLQANPSWEPGQVKSAMMGSTEDIGRIPFEQGTGRLNVSEAVEKDIVTRKQSINYGNITGQVGASREIVLKNIGDGKESISISSMKFLEFNGSDTQDSISVNTTSLVLGAGEKATLEVSTGSIGLDGIYYSYLNLTTNTTGYSHRIPMSVARTAPETPQIAETYPDEKVYTNDEILNLSLEIEPYDVNTTANVTINSTVRTLWEDSDRSSGSTTKNLSEGLSDIKFEVYEAGDESVRSDRSVSAVLDTEAPTIVSAGTNASVVNPSSFLFSAELSDNIELNSSTLEVNTSDRFERVLAELDTSVSTCDAQWGIDCSKNPEYEADNTIDQCETGAGTDESVENIYLNTTELFPGQTVNVTAEYYVWGSVDGLYMYHFDGSDWDQLFSGSRESGTKNVSRTVTLNETGDHTFRAIIDYSPEDDNCASGSFFDNDDVNVTVKPRDINPDGSSDSGSINFSVNNPENRIADWRLNLTDRTGNYDIKYGEMEFNRAPEILNYELRDSSGNKTEIFDQNGTIMFNLTLRDNNTNIDEAVLDIKGPEKDEVYNLNPEKIDNKSIYYLNGSIGAPAEPGQVNLSFIVFDELDRYTRKSRNATIKDFVAPDINSVNASYREVLSWENNTLSIKANDSRGLGKVMLASNRSGSWKNLSGEHSQELNSTEATRSFDLPSNDTVYWRFWVSDRFNNWNSSDVRSFEEVNFSVSFPERAELKEGINITMERPFWYTVNRSDLNWSYTGRADRIENGSNVYGLANFTVHNRGNYTVEVFANDTEGKVNTTNTTIEANVTEPASETGFFRGTPVYGLTGKNYTTRMVFNAKVYNGSEVTLSNSTWNSSLEVEEDIDQVQDSLTSEPYNDTYCEPPGCIYAWPSLEFNYSVNETGDYDLEATLNRSTDQLEDTEVLTFYSKTEMTADIDIADERRRRLVLKGHKWRDINTTFVYPENDTLTFKSVPDLPELSDKYSVELLAFTGQYSSYGIGMAYTDTDIQGSFSVTTHITNETVETEDKRLYRRYTVKPGFEYRKARMGAGYSYDMLDSEVSKENLTVYQCASYTSGSGCDTDWTESKIDYKRLEEDDFDIEAIVNETEAVALGEPYTPPPEEDDDDSSSGDSEGSSGGSSGGGFSIPEDDESGEKESENLVTVKPGEPATVEFDGKSVDGITLRSDEEVESEVNAEEIEDPDLGAPDEVQETHSFINITSTEKDLEANITFSLDESEFSGEPEQVRLYRYSDGWEELSTKFESSTGSTYRFTASTPGFSIFMVGTEKASCPAFQAKEVDGDLCRTFESCETPEGWRKVDSCVEATNTDNTGTDTRQETSDSSGLLVLVVPGTVTVLFISGGALLWRRRKNRKEIEQDFEEVTEAVKKALRSNRQLPESRIQTLIVRADTALKNNDYSRMEDIMEELVQILREN